MLRLHCLYRVKEVFTQKILKVHIMKNLKEKFIFYRMDGWTDGGKIIQPTNNTDEALS